jgi:hypothetical protein
MSAHKMIVVPEKHCPTAPHLSKTPITPSQVPIFSELTEEPDRLLPIKSRRKTSKLVNMISVIIATMCLIMTG